MNSFFLWDLLKTIAISLLIIFLIHHMWTIIVNNTTNKSTKSLIDNQTEKYKKIIDKLTTIPETSQNNTSLQINDIEKQLMIDELNSMVMT